MYSHLLKCSDHYQRVFFQFILEKNEQSEICWQYLYHHHHHHHHHYHHHRRRRRRRRRHHRSHDHFISRDHFDYGLRHFAPDNFGSEISYLPCCFNPLTFENIGLPVLPSDSCSMSHLYYQLENRTGEYQALPLIVLSMFGSMFGTAHVSSILVHALQINFKQQLFCMFDITKKSYFVLFNSHTYFHIS